MSVTEYFTKNNVKRFRIKIATEVHENTRKIAWKKDEKSILCSMSKFMQVYRVVEKRLDSELRVPASPKNEWEQHDQQCRDL